MRRGLFITGTDTEIGKTAVAAGLVCLLRRRGRRMGVCKPVASGCAWYEETLVSDDAVSLQAAVGGAAALSCINPLRLHAPLSPHMAARLEGQSRSDADMRQAILDAVDAAGADAEGVVVEGIGGFLVPLTDTYLVADMVADLALPVLIVAGDRLGVINHTLLTVEAVRARGLPLAGVLLNRCCPPDQAAASNAEALRYVTDAPVFGPLPYRPGATVEERADDLASVLPRETLAAWGLLP